MYQVRHSTEVLFFLQPVGFVTFSDRASAEVAKEELQVRIDDVECDDVTDR